MKTLKRYGVELKGKLIKTNLAAVDEAEAWDSFLSQADGFRSLAELAAHHKVTVSDLMLAEVVELPPTAQWRASRAYREAC